MTNVLCTICARGGSKGVKGKNIKHLRGKPLIAYTIEQAKQTNLFDHIVISTDCNDIADVSIRYGADVFFKRNASLASDTAGKLDVIRDAFIRSEEHYGKKFDYLVDLDATSPLRFSNDINNAFEVLLSGSYNNIITAMPSRKSPYFNLVELNEDGKVFISKKLSKNIVRRQDSPKTYDMNASIYVWKRDCIIDTSQLVLNYNTGLYVMPEERSIDIDTELDFEFAEFLMRKSEC